MSNCFEKLFIGSAGFQPVTLKYRVGTAHQFLRKTRSSKIWLLPKIITAGILSSCHSERSEESRIWSFCGRLVYVGCVLRTSIAPEGLMAESDRCRLEKSPSPPAQKVPLLPANHWRGERIGVRGESEENFGKYYNIALNRQMKVNRLFFSGNFFPLEYVIFTRKMTAPSSDGAAAKRHHSGNLTVR